MRTVPVLGRYTRVMTLNSVVLPAPLGPMRPTTCPASTPNDTRSSATTPPKRTLRSLTSSSAATPPKSKFGWRAFLLIPWLGHLRPVVVRPLGGGWRRVAAVRRAQPPLDDRLGLLNRGRWRLRSRRRLCLHSGWRHRLRPRRGRCHVRRTDRSGAEGGRVVRSRRPVDHRGGRER